MSTDVHTNPIYAVVVGWGEGGGGEVMCRVYNMFGTGARKNLQGCNGLDNAFRAVLSVVGAPIINITRRNTKLYEFTSFKCIAP